MNVNLLSGWVDELQQRGTYTFTRDEALGAGALSSSAANKSLQRLAKRKRVAKVNDSFYVVVPLEYVSAGSPPAAWFIHALMQFKGRPYYVGLLSAAALHGAAHHQPQEFQVITSAVLRPIIVARQRIHFFARQNMETTPVVNVKTPTGMIHVSTPEATVLDLVRFAKAAGNLDNVATIIRDLAEKLQPATLLRAAQSYGEIPTVQRLGFLLEAVGAQAAAGALEEWLASRPFRAIPLQPGRSTSSAIRNPRWKIFVNAQVEVEA